MGEIIDKTKEEVIIPISDFALHLLASLIIFCIIMIYFFITVKVSHYIDPKRNIFSEMLELSSHTTGFALYVIYGIKSVMSYYSKR